MDRMSDVRQGLYISSSTFSLPRSTFLAIFDTYLFIFSMEQQMARVCEVCGKKPMAGNHVSHAHNRVPRRFLPNLQKARVQTASGSAKSILVCTNCIKTGKVRKAA